MANAPNIDISALLGAGGPLAAALPTFEQRPQQIDMAERVFGALTEGRIALLEAGTGTGKSLAYLVPSIHFAKATGHKVIISTKTINLQEQLIHKDIPLVRKALDEDFRVTLVRGWQNYLCHYRLDKTLDSAEELLEPGESAQVTKIGQWIRFNRDIEGIRSDIPWDLPAETWDKINAESDSCLRSKCPHFEGCFFFKARRRMEDSHLLIVNHHLLFADVSVRRQVGWDADVGVLPSYGHIIFDEAHHLEGVATSFLGFHMSHLAMTRLLRKIHRDRSGQSDKGLAVLVRQRLYQAVDDGERVRRAATRIDRQVIPGVHRLEERSNSFFTLLQQTAQSRGRSDGGEVTWRLDKPFEDDPVWTEVLEASDGLVEDIDDLRVHLLALKQDLDAFADDDVKDVDALKHDLDTVTARLRNAAATIEFITAANDSAYVYWIRAGGRLNRVHLVAAPVHVGDDFREWLRNQVDAMVCTSATLTTGENFKYFRERLGLTNGVEDEFDPSSLVEAQIASPFSYQEQALLAVAEDLPEPGDGQYVASLVHFLERLLLRIHGRAFVLFTSFRMLRDVAGRLRPRLLDAGLPLFVHGESPRHVLLERFREHGSAVLFGTDSFWEGVDVPGQALSCVILARLPFRVPTDPVVEARGEALQRQGRNAFLEMALPEAVLKFKQGFGRLIRSRADRGAVVVCDSRVTGKSYGRLFLEALPSCRTLAGSADTVLEEVAAWIES